MIEFEEEPIWSDQWQEHLAHFCLLCSHQYHQPEHFYVNFLLKSLFINVGLILWDSNLKFQISLQQKMQQQMSPPLPLLGQDGQRQHLCFASSPVVDVINTDFHPIAIFLTFDQIVGWTLLLVTVNWWIYSPLLQALPTRKLAIQVGNWSQHPHDFCTSK